MQQISPQLHPQQQQQNSFKVQIVYKSEDDQITEYTLSAFYDDFNHTMELSVLDPITQNQWYTPTPFKLDASNDEDSHIVQFSKLKGLSQKNDPKKFFQSIQTFINQGQYEIKFINNKENQQLQKQLKLKVIIVQVIEDSFFEFKLNKMMIKMQEQEFINEEDKINMKTQMFEITADYHKIIELLDAADLWSNDHQSKNQNKNQTQQVQEKIITQITDIIIKNNQLEQKNQELEIQLKESKLDQQQLKTQLETFQTQFLEFQQKFNQKLEQLENQQQQQNKYYIQQNNSNENQQQQLQKIQNQFQNQENQLTQFQQQFLKVEQLESEMQQIKYKIQQQEEENKVSQQPQQQQKQIQQQQMQKQQQQSKQSSLNIEEEFLQQSILVKSSQDKEQLKKWLPNSNCKTNLLYRASTDGNTSEKFHEKCDNKGPTLVIVKVKDDQNQIVGGYAAISWKTQGNGVEDASLQTFAFNLKNKQKYNLIKQQDALWFAWDKGPVFDRNDSGILHIDPAVNNYLVSMYSDGIYQKINNSSTIINNYVYKKTQYEDYEVFQIM